MTYTLRSTFGLMFMLLLCTAYAGVTEAQEQRRNLITGAYAIMANELSFTDEQREQMQAILEVRAEELAAWNEEHGAKAAALRGKVRELQDSDDADALRDARAELRDLNSSRAAINSKFAAQINELHTDEQKARWAGYNIYTGAMRVFSRITLTDEQKDQAREICYTHGEAALKLSGNARTMFNRGVYTEIAEKVLTDEQREELDG